MLSLTAVALALVVLACSLLIVRHAFQRSLGTAVMVALIPGFILYYAFSQFEHPRKGWVIAAWMSAWVLAIVAMSAIGAPAPADGGLLK